MMLSTFLLPSYRLKIYGVLISCWGLIAQKPTCARSYIHPRASQNDYPVVLYKKNTQSLSFVLAVIGGALLAWHFLEGRQKQLVFVKLDGKCSEIGRQVVRYTNALRTKNLYTLIEQHGSNLRRNQKNITIYDKYISYKPVPENALSELPFVVCKKTYFLENTRSYVEKLFHSTIYIYFKKNNLFNKQLNLKTVHLSFNTKKRILSNQLNIIDPDEFIERSRREKELLVNYKAHSVDAKERVYDLFMTHIKPEAERELRMPDSSDLFNAFYSVSVSINKCTPVLCSGKDYTLIQLFVDAGTNIPKRIKEAVRKGKTKYLEKMMVVSITIERRPLSIGLTKRSESGCFSFSEESLYRDSLLVEICALKGTIYLQKQSVDYPKNSTQEDLLAWVNQQKTSPNTLSQETLSDESMTLFDLLYNLKNTQGIDLFSKDHVSLFVDEIASTVQVHFYRAAYNQDEYEILSHREITSQGDLPLSKLLETEEKQSLENYLARERFRFNFDAGIDPLVQDFERALAELIAEQGRRLNEKRNNYLSGNNSVFKPTATYLLEEPINYLQNGSPLVEEGTLIKAPIDHTETTPLKDLSNQYDILYILLICKEEQNKSDEDDFFFNT